MELRFFKPPVIGEVYFIHQMLLQRHLLKSFYDNDEVFGIGEHKGIKEKDRLSRFKAKYIGIDMIIVNKN
jgi:hypothetical protein